MMRRRSRTQLCHWLPKATWKGSGRPRQCSEKAVYSVAKEMQWNCKWKAMQGNAVEGHRNAVERQWNAKERQWVAR